jgi:hypothetical protein
MNTPHENQQLVIRAHPFLTMWTVFFQIKQQNRKDRRPKMLSIFCPSKCIAATCKQQFINYTTDKLIVISKGKKTPIMNGI